MSASRTSAAGWGGAAGVGAFLVGASRVLFVVRFGIIHGWRFSRIGDTAETVVHEHGGGVARVRSEAEPELVQMFQELQPILGREGLSDELVGRACGVEKDVSFVDAGPGLNDQIDAEYGRKYRGYAANIVGSIVTPQARSGTLKLVPR